MMKLHIAVRTGLVICLCANLLPAAVMFTFQDINHPLAAATNGNGTRAFGIEGNVIVGDYRSGGAWHGYTFDGSNYTSFDHPLAAGETTAYGVWGVNIVGAYKDAGGQYHGFTYNGTSFTTLDHPLGVFGTTAYGIEGSTIIGTYEDVAHKHHGFIYNGTSFATLDNPNGTETWARGITGNSIAGWYVNAGGTTNGYSYDGTTFDSFFFSGSGAQSTFMTDTSSAAYIGNYRFPSSLQRGFYHDRQFTASGTPIVHPNGQDYLTSVEGSTGGGTVGIVGYYLDDDAGVYHGFITIPEPASLGMVCFALTAMVVRRRRD